MDELEKKMYQLSESLNISNTKYDSAIRSYEAIGNYISNNIKHDIRIFPQGSFRLGTVIKPLNDSDEDYDIDLVCIVESLTEDTITAKELKNLIGNTLKASDLYKAKIADENGGKRCWTLVYESEYHLDILPTIKKNKSETDNTLLLTNKDEFNNYTFQSTNPEEYGKWFDSKNLFSKKVLLETKALDYSIEDVPSHTQRTNLQRAIQVVKRFRDEMFKNNNDVKPISIILTTIMASLYDREDSILNIINKFCLRFNEILTKKNGVWIIENPVNSFENFADKWENEPNRHTSFIEFINRLKLIFVETFNNKTFLHHEKNVSILKESFGENIIKKLYIDDSNRLRMLRESGKLYIDDNGNLTEDKNFVKIKDHKFYG